MKITLISQIVSYKLAKLLEEKNFEFVGCLGFFEKRKLITNLEGIPFSYCNKQLQAPTQSQIRRLFKDTYNIQIGIFWIPLSKRYEWSMYINDHAFEADSSILFKTYEDCLEDALYNALESLK